MPEEAGCLCASSVASFAFPVKASLCAKMCSIAQGFYQILPDQVDGEIAVGYLQLNVRASADPRC